VEMLSAIYRLLCYHFGEPPAFFHWRFCDKDNKLGESKTYTPQQFYRDVIGVDLSQYVYLYDSPAHPYRKLYNIQFDRDLFDRPNMTFVNVDIDTIKQLTLKQLMDGEAVWFGCDVGKEFFSDAGILQTGIYDYKSLLGVDFQMTKKERVLYRESVPTHAMVFLGVDVVGGKPVKWRVENSWGASRGDKGYLAMYDEWFDEYLYSVIVNKKYLPEDIRKIFDEEPATLPPWDPMFDMLQ
jgi:bleomycin hydrolase